MRSRTARFVVLTVVMTLASAGVALAQPGAEGKWRRAANEICAESNEEMNTINETAFTGLGRDEQPTVEMMTEFSRQAVPAIDRTLDAIVALDVPRSIRVRVVQWERAARTALDTMATSPESLDDTLFSRANRLGRRLGITCGS